MTLSNQTRLFLLILAFGSLLMFGTSCTKSAYMTDNLTEEQVTDVMTRSNYNSDVHVVSDSGGLNIEIISETGQVWFQASYDMPVNWTAPTCLVPQCYRIKVWYDDGVEGFFSVSVIMSDDTLLSELISDGGWAHDDFCTYPDVNLNPTVDSDVK